MVIISKSYSIGKWIKNIGFIFCAHSQILRASAMLKYTCTFAIPSLGEHLVLVSGHDDMQAVCNSEEDVLSFHEAMTDVILSPLENWGHSCLVFHSA
jgi:hypothetical protein